MNYYSRLCDFAFIAICLSFLHLVTELIKGRFIRKTLKESAVKLPHCGCPGKYPVPPMGKNAANNSSMCSESTSLLGPGQQIVAFSYFAGDTFDVLKRHYFEGIAKNAEAVARHYPSAFRVRLYYHLPPSSTNRSTISDELCRISCSFPRLDLCDAENIPALGNVKHLYPLLWRFLPVLDPQADVSFSRDLDSFASEREAAAVREFLQDPNAQVHIMRDHPEHNFAMLGGTWGAKLSIPRVRRMWKAAMTNLLLDEDARGPRNVSLTDQILLERHVYPWARRLALSHDSYTCPLYRGRDNQVRPFPTRREEGKPCNFVGSRCETVKDSAKYKCPASCRADPNWDMC